MDAFVAGHLEGVSRTYAIVVPMLPAPLDEAVGIAYLVMRIVDTIEDSPQLDDADRLALLDALSAALAGDAPSITKVAAAPGDTPAERALLQDTPQLVQRLQALDPAYRSAIVSCADAMGRGVRQFMQRSRERGRPYPAVQDADELREYCYYVAGVVGEMLCAMMAHHLERPALLQLRPLAVELGIGLQLVNVLKDAARDAEQGRRYLPHAAGDARHVVFRTTIATARGYLRRGVDYVLALPPAARALRAFCGLPIAWGALTLRKAEQSPRAAKIGRDEVERSIARFTALAGDDAPLRGWLCALLDARAASPGTV